MEEAQDLITEIRKNISILKPYGLHKEKLYYSDLQKYPILFITEKGKLKYLFKIPELGEIEFELKGTLTEGTLKKGEQKIIYLKKRFLGNSRILRGYSYEVYRELMYHIAHFIKVYETYIKNIKRLPEKIKNKIKKIRGVNDIKWLNYPIYLFGIPRAVIVIPELAKEELSLVVSTLSISLEKLIWDIFISRFMKSLEKRKSINDALEENIFLLILPYNCWNGKLKLKYINIKLNKIPIKIPQTNNSKLNKLFLNNIQVNTIKKIEYFIESLFGIMNIIKKESLRSAVAAIMARNKAHIFSSQILMRFDLNEISKPLLDYIVTRDEYLADVTGEIPPLWGKGRIYWEANNEEIGIIPDYKETEILSKLAEASSGKIKEIKIEINGLNEETGFPFGVSVGRHAIYSILENYIRNVSKYGKIADSNKILEVTLSKINDTGKYIEVKLTSNSLIGKKQDWRRKAQDIYKYTISPIIDETGKITKKWGIAEMKIHACILAGERFDTLMNKGETGYFKFDYDKAETKGEYTFYFRLRKYVEKVVLQNNNEVEEFIKSPPLCDFVIFKGNTISSFNEENFYLFPIRVVCSEKNKVTEKWLKKGIIVSPSENLKDLWSAFWESLKEFGAVEYKKIQIFDNDESYIIGDRTNGNTFAIYHQEIYNIKKSEIDNFSKKVGFSHQGNMMVWYSDLKTNGDRKLLNKSQNNYQYYQIQNEIQQIKWKILLGTKMVFIDNRLYELYENYKDAKERKSDIGIYVFPEKAKIERRGDKNSDFVLKYKGMSLPLSKIQFISVHYGYLEENPKTPLLQSEYLLKFPPYLFMHTARGKIEKDFIQKYWWFKRIISVGSLESAFKTKYDLEKKIRLLETFLSLQGGVL